MRGVVAGISDEPQRNDATQWLNWVAEYRKAIDPLRGSLSMPLGKTPSEEELKPFLHGWSPYGPSSYG